MYLMDDVEVRKDQLTILRGSKDFLFLNIGGSTRTDATLVQTDTIQCFYFHNT